MRRGPFWSLDQTAGSLRISALGPLSAEPDLALQDPSSQPHACASNDTEGSMTDLERLLEWTDLLDDDRLACLVEIAAVLAADQMGVYSDPVDL